MAIATFGDPLLLRLYGSCTESKRWRETLDILCTETGSRSAVVHAIQVKGSQVRSYWTAHDTWLDSFSYDTFTSDLSNPRLERERLRRVAGGLVSDEDLFRDVERPIVKRLQTQLGDIGLGRFLGALAPVGSERYVALALHRDLNDRSDFSTRQRDRIVSLLPHFQQAVSLAETVAASQTAEALLRCHLDRWQCGLVVCGPSGEVQWLNQKARVQLNAGHGLFLRDSVLKAVGSLSQKRLSKALQDQAASSTPGFLAIQSGNLSWHLAVQGLDSVGQDGRGSLLITLTDNHPAGQIPAEALMALFELTSAEAKLTSALVAGTSLEEYALLRGVTVGTARYQLKRVLAKTGSSRQSDLVRRVLCSAAGHIIDLAQQ